MTAISTVCTARVIPKLNVSTYRTVVSPGAGHATARGQVSSATMPPSPRVIVICTT